MPDNQENVSQLKKIAKDLTAVFIDDDPLIREVFSQMLGNFFKEVMICSSAQEFIKTYSNYTFDIVFTDINMPEMDGLEMSKSIKATDPEQVIVVFTAHSESEYMLEAFDLNIDGYLMKPFNITDSLHTLLRVTKKVVQRKSALEGIKTLEQKNSSVERWKHALDANRDGLWDWNIETNDVFFSKQWKNMLGYKETEIEGSLEEWEKRVRPEHLQRVKNDIQNHMDQKSDFYENEHQVLCKDGSYMWVLDRGAVIQRDENGTALRMVGTHTDIDERKQLQEQVKNERKKYQYLLESAMDGLHVVDQQGYLSECSNAFAEMLGYSKDEILGQHVTKWSNASSEELRYFEDILKNQNARFETELICKDSSLIKVEMIVNMIELDSERFYYASARDMSELHRLAALLKEQSLTDMLTKVHNRKSYVTKLGEMLSVFERYQTIFSFLVLDIDNFKSINDTHGHSTGDKVLVDFADEISSNIRANDYFFRIGGEEFVLLLNNTDIYTAEKIADKLRQKIQDRLTYLDDRDVTVSIGVTEVQLNDTQESIFSRADENLYVAKRTGRNKVVAKM